MEEKRVGRMIHLKHNNNNIPGLIPQVRSSTEGRIYVDYTPLLPIPLWGKEVSNKHTTHEHITKKARTKKKK